MVSEKGHYGGRTFPTNTRQGTYMLTAAGEFLASVNTNDPNHMVQVMQQALERWRGLSKEQRIGPELKSKSDELRRFERFYPEDGLAFAVFSRDMPRNDPPTDWRVNAWNKDFLWYRKEEMKGFVPQGKSAEVPTALVRRMAQAVFVDNVRGQTESYRAEHVKVATLSATRVSQSGNLVKIRFEGKTETEASGRWRIEGLRNDQDVDMTRGISLTLLGFATYDTKAERFKSFEIVGVGPRRGATQYNVRFDDMGPRDIGFALRMGTGKPEERIAPAHIWVYGW